MLHAAGFFVGTKEGDGYVQNETVPAGVFSVG